MWSNITLVITQLLVTLATILYFINRRFAEVQELDLKKITDKHPKTRDLCSFGNLFYTVQFLGNTKFEVHMTFYFPKYNNSVRPSSFLFSQITFISPGMPFPKPLPKKIIAEDAGQW